jgi:ABC-type microcin C transport system permease subunit YejB
MKEGEYIIRRLILVLEMVVSFSTITFILARVVPSEARTA